MQTDIILQLFTPYIQKETAKLSEELRNTWDFRQFEDGMMKLMSQLEALLTMCILEECLSDPAFLIQLQLLGGKLGMHFKEYRTLRIRLCNGLQVTVSTPYFLKTKSKRGRKKKGPNGRGKHLGLEVMGILGKVSPAFLSKTVQMALLCPSFEVTKAVLAEQGVQINVKTMRRYCKLVGAEGMKWRGLMSLDGVEKLEGSTVVVGIDGGRLRERKRKPGRWKKNRNVRDSTPNGENQNYSRSIFWTLKEKSYEKLLPCMMLRWETMRPRLLCWNNTYRLYHSNKQKSLFSVGMARLGYGQMWSVCVSE